MRKQAVTGGDRPSRAEAAMEARRPRRAPNEYVTFREETAEASSSSVHHPDDEAASDAHNPEAAQPHGTPWYVAPVRRPRQVVDDHQPSYPYGRLPAAANRTMPGPVRAPPRGPRLPPPGSRLTSTKIERVSTLNTDTNEDDEAHHAAPPRQHRQRHTEWTPSPLPMERRKKRAGAAFCFTACCILFWLVVIAMGVAVLVVYLIYHPKPPRLWVEDATLNAGYIDELPRRRLALNSDLSVLAAIANPNTKVDVVMRSMELDLYFEGNMIGTTAVWPAPLHEGPRGYVLRDVRIVVSEVVLPRQDAMAWHNATSKGGPVVLHLAGRFHAQLNFGRWLPFRYWIYPRCTLWLDPPPSGTLRRVRC